MNQKVKILIYECGKFLLAMGTCGLSFSLIPLSIYVILLPIELAVCWLLWKKISLYTWVGLSFLTYIGFVIFSYAWIMNGHTGLNFLLDWN